MDKVFVKYSAYTIATATAIYLMYIILSNIGSILRVAGNILGSTLSLFSPLIIGLIVAYILHPMVNWIDLAILRRIRPSGPTSNKSEKYRQLPRTVSVLITYLLFLSVIVLLIYGLYVLISGSLPKNFNLSSMIWVIGNYSQSYEELFSKMILFLQTAGLSENIKGQLLGLVQTAQNFTGQAISGIFSSFQQIWKNLVDIVLGIVIAFYLLKDLEYFKSLYNKTTQLLFCGLPKNIMSGFLAEVDGVISSFIRGQLLVALIVGVISSIALYIVGLDYAVLVGMTAGLCNIIPYFGPVAGSIIAIIVALVTGSPLQALLAVVALLVVQQIDGNIISPKVVGDSMGLHPLFIVLAFIIGGSLYGLLGMLLAVPAAGIVKLLLIRFSLGRIEKS
ncbi:MAG: AI-2E family transporter [Peptococcaceae bacterium]|nr:AI-2E family transporter [Peptococcaceae bacterium]